MSPQTVNAYYNSRMNEIVFPAAILQAPFFNPDADDAVNYGGIGAVIGHEISHGFDDSGSQSDGDGNLRDWWTAKDKENFGRLTSALVAQYESYSPLPGYNVNGKLTLGENIADNSGLSIAYKAYKLSLGGKPSTTIDGFSGEQRVFIGWAQVWRGKARDKETIRLLATDPHSPAAVRGNAPLTNIQGFYDAFGVKESDKMFVAPENALRSGKRLRRSRRPVLTCRRDLQETKKEKLPALSATGGFYVRSEYFRTRQNIVQLGEQDINMRFVQNQRWR
jgi:predicted metalloendopeptidase